jgi:hypothetical protein
MCVSSQSEHDLVAGMFLRILQPLDLCCVQRALSYSCSAAASTLRFAVKRLQVLIGPGIAPRIFHANCDLVGRAWTVFDDGILGLPRCHFGGLGLGGLEVRINSGDVYIRDLGTTSIINNQSVLFWLLLLCLLTRGTLTLHRDNGLRQ